MISVYIILIGLEHLLAGTCITKWVSLGQPSLTKDLRVGVGVEGG